MRAETTLTPLFLPVSVLDSDELQADVKIVYGRLCTPERRRLKFLEVDVNALAAETGKAERNVIKALQRLKLAKLIKHLEVKNGRIYCVVNPPPFSSWSTSNIPAAVIAWPELRGATQLCYAHLWSAYRDRRNAFEIEHSTLPGTNDSNRGKQWLENLAQVGLLRIVARRRGHTTVQLIDPDRAWQAHLEQQRKQYARSIA